MGVIEEGILTFFCGVGGISIAVCFFLFLLRPLCLDQSWIVLPARGDGDEAENILQWYAWLRRMGLLRGEVVLWDVSLTPKGRELALHLTLRWPWVSCCPPGALEEWLSQANEPVQ